MHRTLRPRMLLGAVALTLGSLAVGASTLATLDWGFSARPKAPAALPPLPSPVVYPVQMVLDDDTADGSFGLLAGPTRQFLWFNRFTPGVLFSLREVWVLFPAQQPELVPGAAIQLAIFEDPDGDPSNGATLLQAVDETVQVADGNTFSVYTLAVPVDFTSGGDVLIGVVPRFIGPATPPTQPAAIDTTASQGRSWVAVWSTDPPNPPALVPAPDVLLEQVDTVLAGNWMIRGFGVPLGVVEVPALSSWGLSLLAGALCGISALALRRRRLGGTK